MELVPADLSQLLKPLEKEHVQVVYGSRFLNGRGNASIHNFMANRLLATYTNLLYGCRITDESTGYKAFSTALITRLNLTCEGFEFCPEVTSPKSYVPVIAFMRYPSPIFRARRRKARNFGSGRTGCFAAWTLLKISIYFKNRTFQKQRAR